MNAFQKEDYTYNTTKINGKDVYLLSFENMSNGFNIKYDIYFIETENYYSEICCCYVKKLASTYENDINTFLNSFEEVK